MTRSINRFLDLHEAEILLRKKERLAAMAHSAAEVIHVVVFIYRWENPLSCGALCNDNLK